MQDILSRQSAIEGVPGWRLLPLLYNESIPLPGITSFRVLRGKVSINGAYLTESEEVFKVVAPVGLASIPQVVAVTSEDSAHQSTMAHHHDNEIELDVDDSGFLPRSFASEYPVVIAVSNELRSLPPDTEVISIPSRWEAVARIVSTDMCSPDHRPPRAVVIGSKGSGKSTFCRFLLNRILSETKKNCLLLDIDPGQPELQFPGSVSLCIVDNYILSLPHAPSSHRVIARRFFGALSPASDPQGYVDLISELLSIADDYSLPMVVNTHGWVAGAGALTLGAVVALVSPEIVIELGGVNDQQRIDLKNHSLLSNEALSSNPLIRSSFVKLCDTQYVNLPIGGEGGPRGMGAQELRWLRIACILRPEWKDRVSWEGQRPRDFYDNLHERVFNRNQVGVKFIGSNIDKHLIENNEWLAEALVGTLVALCQETSDRQYPNCKSLGVVVAVFPEKFHVLTLENDAINLLVRGGVNWSPRDCGWFERAGSEINTATCSIEERYALSGAVGEGGRNGKGRTNLTRKRLQGGDHK